MKRFYNMVMKVATNFFLLTFLHLLAFNTLTAQTKIELKDVEQHIGSSVTVCGNILNIKHLENVKNKPVLVNIGSNDPSEHLDVVVENENLWLIDQLDTMMAKRACIVGTPAYYKGGSGAIYLKAADLKFEERQVAASNIPRQQPVSITNIKGVSKAAHNTSFRRIITFNIGANEPGKKELLIEYLKHGRIISFRQTQRQKIYTIQLKEVID